MNSKRYPTKFVFKEGQVLNFLFHHSKIFLHHLSGILFILEPLQYLILGLLSGLLFTPQTFSHFFGHSLFHFRVIFMSFVPLCGKLFLHLPAEILDSRAQHRHLLQHIIVLIDHHSAPLSFRPGHLSCFSPSHRIVRRKVFLFSLR